MKTPLTIIVTGYAATYPFGGVAWDYLQYVVGFKRLGHDVYYLEDTSKWMYDPFEETFSDNPRYNVNYLAETLAAFRCGLEDRWCIRDVHGNYWGLSHNALAEVCKKSDLFLNLSGSCFLREEYLKSALKIYLDSDPLYSQAAIVDYVAGTDDSHIHWLIDHMRLHDFFFSFGENIGKPGCSVPSDLFEWRPTRQPIMLSSWPHYRGQSRDLLTTVMSWQPAEEGPVVRGISYGGKHMEFEKFLDLPERTSQRLELAIGGGKPPLNLLREKGWRVVNGYTHSSDLWKYRHYILTSKGEFSVAKNAYVATRSGWFSCRSACYLAAGKPVIVQETGFSDILPTGYGILAFSTPEEAIEGIEAVNRDYARHSAAAREIAEEYFDSDKVLRKLLRDIGLEG
ncbi:MAG: glycosyltransferase family 1 protein [Candidatus Tectomicrobia bacterium]|nr:glycosyltransferase family 1 protein [Candidatus Tectomicrobia bacterium]